MIWPHWGPRIKIQSHHSKFWVLALNMVLQCLSDNLHLPGKWKMNVLYWVLGHAMIAHVLCRKHISMLLLWPDTTALLACICREIKRLHALSSGQLLFHNQYRNYKWIDVHPLKSHHQQGHLGWSVNWSTKLICKRCLKKDPINETEHQAIEMVRSAKYGTGWNETPQGKKIKEIPRDFKSSPCTQFQNNEITFQGESATKKLATKTLHIVRPVDWEFKASGVKGSRCVKLDRS